LKRKGFAVGEVAYRVPAWRIVTGIVISLLLHAAAVLFLRLPEPRQVADTRTWLAHVQARIVPAPPPMSPPQPEASSAEAEPKPRKRLTRIERRPQVRRPAAQSGESSPPVRESTLVLRPAEPAEAPAFDPEAAKAAARNIAGELDAPPSDAPNAQVRRNAPKYRETRDEKLARQIQSAARANCKDGIPGGLLAPLILMMDKKDSGCKW
jgi:hypothetical protein